MGVVGLRAEDGEVTTCVSWVVGRSCLGGRVGWRFVSLPGPFLIVLCVATYTRFPGLRLCLLLLGKGIRDTGNGWIPEC